MSHGIAARVEAQAKINLSLRILAQEQSGYHQLETLFARIDLADTVEVALDPRDRAIVVEGADVGPPEQNLAYRAAVAFLEATRWATGFRIRVVKRIPVGGGLGGGSADAGAVLRILNTLAPHPLSPAALLTIAVRLGADVPFLAVEAPVALAWGRGERLLALPPLPSRELLLVVPPFGVNTGAAFGWVAAQRQGEPISAPAPLAADDLARWDRIVPLAANDFEGAVGAHHPAIGSCLDALRAAGATIARLSGSGSTVFGVFDGEAPTTLPGLPDGTRILPTRVVPRVASVERLG
ncbi:MAG: 4-(cytidine 5'-diphospho)-2-C-methyl-D-erythritol kinase [Gemmatimonadaceae bacterium]